MDERLTYEEVATKSFPVSMPWALTAERTLAWWPLMLQGPPWLRLLFPAIAFPVKECVGGGILGALVLLRFPWVPLASDAFKSVAVAVCLMVNLLFVHSTS